MEEQSGDEVPKTINVGGKRPRDDGAEGAPSGSALGVAEEPTMQGQPTAEGGAQQQQPIPEDEVEKLLREAVGTKLSYEAVAKFDVEDVRHSTDVTEEKLERLLLQMNIEFEWGLKLAKVKEVVAS